MSEPRISVLLPVYNGAEFLAEALDSIWAQTFCDFEVLVVDDGSTDRTPEILGLCRDPRLRVLRNETRLKLSGALNRGLDEARGELIARMDADDRMCRDRLSSQVDFLTCHPEVICCGGWIQLFGKGSKIIQKFPSGPERVKAFALFYTPFAHPTVMFRREDFAREGLRYDGSFYPTEDYELWSRALLRFPCDNLQRVLVDYRVHENSMTGGEWSDMDDQTVRIQRQILSRLDLEPSEEESRIHRSASMGTLPSSSESFFQTEAWLLKLLEANQHHRIYNAEALKEILHFVWFRMSMAAVRVMGGEAWRFYRRSPLSNMGPHARTHRWTMRVAALKADLMGRRG